MDHNVDPKSAEVKPLRLADDISQILQRAGHPRPTDWEAGFLAQHPDAGSDSVMHQRLWINRYWRAQLSALDVNTMDQRYCLVDDGSIADWLRIFEQGVAPCIVRYSLPRTTH